MLIEVFCENLIDIHIKREIKRLVRSQTTISFSALRSEAIRLEEDGMGNSYQNACVRGIQEPHHTPGDSSPLDRIATQLELLATTQSEIVSLLRSQQAPMGVVNPDRPEPRSGGVVYCEYTPIISCEIANQPTNMVLDMGSEVTIIQEWWFDEYCLNDASLWLRLKAANSLGFPYVGYFITDVNVLGTIVKDKGILVQKDPPGLTPQNNLTRPLVIMGYNYWVLILVLSGRWPTANCASAVVQLDQLGVALYLSALW